MDGSPGELDVAFNNEFGSAGVSAHPNHLSQAADQYPQRGRRLKLNAGLSRSIGSITNSWAPSPGVGLAIPQEASMGLEPAGALERMQLVTATGALVVDEDLGQRAAP